MTMKRLLPAAGLALLLAACAGPSPRTTTTRAPEPDAPSVPEARPDSVPDGRCNTCGVVEHIERTAAAAAPAGQDDAPKEGGIVNNVLAGSDAPPRATGFAIRVRLDSGQVVTVQQRALGGVRQGQRVEVVDGRARPVLEAE